MQQINLYQEQFRKQKIPLSATMIMTVLVLAVLGLAALHYINYLGLAPLEAEQAQATREVQELTAKVAVAEQAAKPKPVDRILEKEVQQLVARLQRNRQLLTVLTRGSMSNTSGFSEYFQTMAERHVTGTWITGMRISSGGSEFAFAGKSLNPELVPKYLENLSGADVFNNFTFNVLEIKRSEKDEPVINFNIATGKG